MTRSALAAASPPSKEEELKKENHPGGRLAVGGPTLEGGSLVGLKDLVCVVTVWPEFAI
jgi:hypothetical protein